MCSKIVELRQQLKESIMLDRSFLNINAIKESIEDGLIKVNALMEDSNNLSRVLDILLELEALQELLQVKEEELKNFVPTF